MPDPLATPVFDPNEDARQKLVQSLSARLQAMRAQTLASQAASGSDAALRKLGARGVSLVPPPKAGSAAPPPPAQAPAATAPKPTSPQLQALLDRTAQQRAMREKVLQGLVYGYSSSSPSQVPLAMLGMSDLDLPAKDGLPAMGVDLSALSGQPEVLDYIYGTLNPEQQKALLDRLGIGVAGSTEQREEDVRERRTP